MEGDDDIIVLDLEDGEIQSDIDTADSPKIKTKSISKWNRRSRSRKSKTPQKNPPNRDILDEITLVGSDEESDDDCKLVAIVAPAKPTHSGGDGPAIKRRKGSFRNHTPVGAEKLGFASRFEEIRRRSLLRRSSSSKVLAKVLSVPKKDSPIVQPQPRLIGKKALKRLKKSKFGGTPVVLPPVPVPNRPIRYFNVNHRHPGNGRGRNHHSYLGVRNQQNEERTGKSRKRPLIPYPPGGENMHQVLRNPSQHNQGFQRNTNNSFFRNVLPPPQLLGSNVHVFCQPPPPLGAPRPVIIDGSNVAIGHGNGRVFSSRGLEICVKHVKETLRHTEIICFVPKFRAKRTESLDTHILDKLESDGILKYTPSREVNGKHITSYDDRFILDYATTSGGIVITNDNYKDLFVLEPTWRETIQNRLLQYTWVNDVLMFPSDPLGKHGPNLDRFCSFDAEVPSMQPVSNNPIPSTMLQPSYLQNSTQLIPNTMLQPSYLQNSTQLNSLNWSKQCGYPMSSQPQPSTTSI